MHEQNKSARRAYVFGNVAIDEVLRVRNLPKTGQSVLAQGEPLALGGKGANQAIALARTGVKTTLVAAVGPDRNADLVRKGLSREQLHSNLIQSQMAMTDRSVILADDAGNNIVVTTNACARSVSASACLPVLADAQEGDVVLLQGNLQEEVTARICREAKRRNLVTALNPSPVGENTRELLPLTDILFVNETEAYELTGLSEDKAARALLSAKASQVVLTLGAEGSLLATDGQIIRIPATTAVAVDVTGAGDCFEGVALGSAMLRQSNIDKTALLQASIAASMTIGRFGASASFPTQLEISEILQNQTSD